MNEYKICRCDCHIKGTHILHVMRCCGLTYQKYINEDGSIDWALWHRLMDERGLKKFRIGEEPDLNLTFDKIVLPVVKSRFPKKKGLWWRFLRAIGFKRAGEIRLDADKIVSVQPMTALVKEGLFEMREKHETGKSKRNYQPGSKGPITEVMEKVFDNFNTTQKEKRILVFYIQALRGEMAQYLAGLVRHGVYISDEKERVNEIFRDARLKVEATLDLENEMGEKFKLEELFSKEERLDKNHSYWPLKKKEG